MYWSLALICASKLDTSAVTEVSGCSVFKHMLVLNTAMSAHALPLAMLISRRCCVGSRSCNRLSTEHSFAMLSSLKMLKALADG